MVVCPYSVPPFETLLGILAILLVAFVAAERQAPTEPKVSSKAQVRNSKAKLFG